MSYILGIQDSITDGGTNFYPHTSSSHWNGETNQFSQETSATSIFIDDNLDLNLKSKCVLELNSGNNDGKVIFDTSGNGNRGMLIGDYSVEKPSKDMPIRRDSDINLPETETEDGAL